MAVTIDIPGVGNVEAKNAASEATLREILKAMQGVEKKITGKNSKGGGGGDTSADDPVKGPGAALGAAFGKLSKTVMPVVGGFQAVGKALSSITGIIGNFANVGDSLERAAQQVPIFGGMLGTVAAASVRANDAFLSAARSGAGFGDDLNEFARSASAAGMTLDKFGSFISSNSEGLIGLGSTVGQGVDNFTKISKTIRATGSDLFALGYSTEDINKGIANFGGLLRIQGRQGTMTNEQLANASKNYMKEIDALAKATGEERSTVEANMKKMAQDAQFSSYMSTKSTDVQNSFNSLITRMGPTLGNFAKDFITTGSLTSEATQKIGALYGQEALAELQRLRNLAQANQKATAADSDRAVGVMINSSKRVQQQFGQTMAQSGGAFNDVANANIDANKLQADAMVNANAEQRKAAEEGKKFNEQLQKSQATLAKFSNDFTIALANSGLLDFLMKAFGVMATLVQTIVVPAFNFIASAINMLISPIEYVAAFIEDNFTAVIMGVGTALGIYAGLTIAANAAKIAEIGVTIAKTVAMLALIGPLAIVALGLAALASPLGIFAVVAAGLVFIFKKLYDSGWSFGTAIEAIKDNLRRFELFFVDGMLAMLEKIAGWFGKGDTIKAARAKIAEEKQELDDREKARDGKRKATADERQAEKDKNAVARENNKIGKKEIADKKAIIDEKNKLDKLDTNASPEALLKQFGLKENSKFAIDGKKVDVNKEKEAAEKELTDAKTTAAKEAALEKIKAAEKKLADLDKLSKGEGVPKEKSRESLPKAEAAKKELEQKGEEKTAALKKAAEEQAKAEEKAKAENKKEGKGTPPAQESAESLLASLNTKMTELIKINKGTQAVSEQQLSVQKGMTSDLFAA
jgi:hypothetical protein